MLDPSHPLAQLLAEDKRYTFDAYVFVFEALNYAQSQLEMGTEVMPESEEEETDAKSSSSPRSPERHVTGQDLCEAIRQFALEQFGYMAKDVLNRWGIHETGDFGEIVFNLIRIGQMRKTKNDCREDFEDVYNFDTAFRQEFKINPPTPS